MTMVLGKLFNAPSLDCDATVMAIGCHPLITSKKLSPDESVDGDSTGTGFDVDVSGHQERDKFGN